LTRYHWGEPQHFYADTVAICERITTEYKQFDASPLQCVYSAVCSWHESRSADGLPTQQVLFSALARAMVVVSALQNANNARLQDDRDKPIEADVLVTLDDLHAISRINKRTLERYRSDGMLPAPYRKGGHGRPDKWWYKDIRPQLEPLANRPLPPVSPGT
jgi:hypothetical protein